MIKKISPYFFLAVFFSTLLAVNPKTFLLVFAAAVLILFFFFKKSLIESVFLTFLISLPFENPIRDWTYYNNAALKSGFAFHFALSPKLIIALFLCILLLLPNNKQFIPKTAHPKASSFLLIFFLLSVITSLCFQTSSPLIFFGMIRLFLSIGIYFFTSNYFSRTKNRQIFQQYIFSLIIFTVSIGLIQLVRQKPLGYYVELTPGFSLEDGYQTTDGITQYRVTSFISHPVYFGSFLSMLLPIIISFLWKKILDIKPIYIAGVTFITLIVLVGALSRSTWINILLVLSAFYYYSRHHRIDIPQLKFKSPVFSIIVMLVMLCVSVPTLIIVLDRTKSLSDIFNENGSGTTRIELIEKSFQLMKYRPLSGVGLNRFPFELIQTGVRTGEAAPVHNTFLLFAAELGIPAALLFIAFLVTLLKDKLYLLNGPIYLACWLSALTFIVSSQFHPLFNLDPSFDLFMFILGFIAACQTASKN